MCVHLSRLDRLDGLVCSFCEDGGRLASDEVAARYGALNIAHGRRRFRRERRGYTLPLASAARGALRLLGPYLLVIVVLVGFGLVAAAIESI